MKKLSSCQTLKVYNNYIYLGFQCKDCNCKFINCNKQYLILRENSINLLIAN